MPAVAISNFALHFAAVFLRVWESDTDGRFPKLHAEALDYPQLWLIPGFELDQFSDALARLPESERVKLANRFGAYTRAANSDAPTGDELLAAADAFAFATRKLNLLMWMTWGDPESISKLIREQIEKTAFREWVVGFDFATGLDWSGDTAIWIWMIVKDESPETPEFTASLDELRTRLWNANFCSFDRNLVYTSLRTVGEQVERIRGESY